eukprot:GFYU01001539.1.p1 GENE.GFYU01001539.1~~GFYU01001539.1.p1  ORF type:complete len:524 (-),score=86.71 GFYU01001539.1:213-1784(-)
MGGKSSKESAEPAKQRSHLSRRFEEAEIAWLESNFDRIAQGGDCAHTSEVVQFCHETDSISLDAGRHPALSLLLKAIVQVAHRRSEPECPADSCTINGMYELLGRLCRGSLNDATGVLFEAIGCIPSLAEDAWDKDDMDTQEITARPSTQEVTHVAIGQVRRFLHAAYTAHLWHSHQAHEVDSSFRKDESFQRMMKSILGPLYMVAKLEASTIPPPGTAAAATPVDPSDPVVSLSGFVSWFARHIPRSYDSVRALLSFKLLDRKVIMTAPDNQWLDSLGRLVDRYTRWQLQTMISDAEEFEDAVRAQPWSCLYSTWKHGCSYNRFDHHVSHYPGPNLVIMRDTGGTVFGAYVPEQWKDQSAFRTNRHTMLFQLSDSHFVCRPVGKDDNHIYMNSHGKNPHGIGFGGHLKDFRLWIDDGLIDCEAKASCTSFEYGKLNSEEKFKIDLLEVYGLGGDEAASRAEYNQDREDQIKQDMRKVDRAAWADNPDKFILTLAGKAGYSDNIGPELPDAGQTGAPSHAHPS